MSKISERSSRFSPLYLPTIELWNADRYARLTETEHGFHIEMLSYPGKREGYAPTEKEARKIALAFLKAGDK